MPAITAILHTLNDALRIARAVESLRPCDEVLVIDHGSTDGTPTMARRFGARVIETQHAPFDTKSYIPEIQHDWILCLLPDESLSEGLEASLLEWKSANPATNAAFAVSVLEETTHGWAPARLETRLVHRQHSDWSSWKPHAWKPQGEAAVTVLEGDLFRLHLP